MDDYIKETCEQLDKNSISGISKLIKNFSSENVEKMLKDAGYLSDASVLEHMEQSYKYLCEYGELKLSDKKKKEILEKYKNDAILAGYTKNKTVIFILGLPGAGKSTLARTEIEKEFINHHFMTLDADDFKFGVNQNNKQITKSLVDKKLNGIDINSIHEVSSNLALLALDMFTELNFDLLLPKVGGDFEKLKASIEELKNKGYKVYIYFVFTTVETALKRNLNRFKDKIEKGEEIRLVDPTYIIGLGYRPLNNFFKLVNNVKCDGFVFWNGEINPPKKYLLK